MTDPNHMTPTEVKAYRQMCWSLFWRVSLLPFAKIPTYDELMADLYERVVKIESRMK